MKISKLTAVIISTALISSMSAAPSADASSWWEKTGLTAEFTLPEGFTDFTETDTYKNHMEYFSETGTPSGIPLYLSDEYPCYIGMYQMYYNTLSLKVTDDSWQEIYSSYSQQLDMDVFDSDEDAGTVSMSDLALSGSSDGISDYERMAGIPEKFELMAEMCREMYAADCIESAWYTPFYGYNGTHFKALEMKVSGVAATSDEFTAVVTEKASYAEISSISDDGSAYSVDFPYESASVYDFFDVIDSIEAEYPEAKVSAVLFNYEDEAAEWYPELPDASSERIDVLALAADTDPADINSDGKTGILDIITLSKAASGIVALNEERTVIADLNSDGTVDGGDVTLLMQYLVGLVDAI